MSKHRIQLGDVQETLLIPLYMRALETRRPDAILRDDKAVEIVDAIDYDFAKFDSPHMQLEIAVRTEILDEEVGAFIARRPQCMVVNLGAGLDGRFFRVDNGQVLWIDLDLPDAIDLRGRFYPPSARNRLLACSAFDYRWMDELDRGPATPVLLIAEGFFPYIEQRDVRDLFSQVARRLPGAEFLFQTTSPKYVNQQEIVPSVNRTKAVLKWGISSGRELSEWDPRYEFLAEWAFVDRHRSRWRTVLRWWFLPPIYRDLRQTMKITHMRIGG
jgi:O-methyltransferase involved in polyketide biosynthesis